MSKIPNLFVIMNKKGISQKQLAEFIGASTGNVSDWKSGKSAPAIEKLPLIADYLDVSLDYLLGRADNSVKPASELSNDEIKLLNSYKNLEPYQKELILHDIELLNRNNESAAKASEAI